MTPILHHYPTSPFAELIRAALGVKGLAWQSVIIPNMMPKPGLTALTGGYGRTPVLQIGADIYCDTAAILDALETLPGPSLYPAPLGPLHRMIGGWAGAAQFGAHVGAAMRHLPPGVLSPEFIADRKARFGGAFDFATLPLVAPHLESQVFTAAAWIDSALTDGRAFIGGDDLGHGDLALYANIWFLSAMPFAKDAHATVMAHPLLAAWYGRIAAFGHGSPTEISADDAIAIARDAEPAVVVGSVGGGFTTGQAVAVKTEGSGDTPVAGTLTRCDAGGITVMRESGAAGTVAVHFPRIGQIVIPA